MNKSKTGGTLQTNGNENIERLQNLIKKYQDSYYSGDAEISDADFDLLWDELKKFDPQNALLKKIGEDFRDGFPKVKHIMLMGSQEKAANENEFSAWAQKAGLKTFVVQHKLDGISLELQYKNGILQKAVTRGNGKIGDDITGNARKMQGVIENIKHNYTGAVRGEVLLFHDVWKTKYSSKANCRNAANGIIHRKEGLGSEDLTLIVYDAYTEQNTDIDTSEFFAASGNYFKTETDKIQWLQDCGFNVSKTKICNSVQEVIDYRNEVSLQRTTLDFDIDGLVVKDNKTDTEDLKRDRPQKQIAFKFDLEQAISILRQVEWSESGATYTPIGIVDPVRLAGTTVKRANLCNPAMIRGMGLQIGSSVLVVKRGEIIPKIEGVVDANGSNADKSTAGGSGKACGFAARGAVPPSKNLTPIEIPFKCETCGAALVDEGTRLYCPNNMCEKRLFHRLQKWIAVMNIMEVGEKLLHRLFENGRVKKIADLYTLDKNELSQFDRMGELSAVKIVKNISEKKEIRLAQFVAGFDIEGIGETVMEKICDAGFDTIEKLCVATVEELAEVFGIGDITAESLKNGLSENRKDIDALQEYVRILPPFNLDSEAIDLNNSESDRNSKLLGKSFCFTGELSAMKRRDAQDAVRKLGGSIKTTVVKDLSYLVTNDVSSGSLKNKKATEAGVQIIDEDTFLLLLK